MTMACYVAFRLPFKAMTASPEYFLTMKYLAMRIGEEFHDLDDVCSLLRNLD